MASMVDLKPSEYEGEKVVWQSIKDNLPNDIICYYNREVKGREFDFCLLIKDIGFLIIEVKGWHKNHIVSVKSPDEIKLSNGSVSRSPKKQARSYAFGLKNILNEKYSIDPLVMNMVCYPFLSEYDYMKCGLDIVSEPEFTLFSEDISSLSNFTRKILGVYQNSDSINFDKMSGNIYDIARHHFEPSYNIDKTIQNVLPYSCLSVYTDTISIKEMDSIIRSYCSGTKQVIFTNNLGDIELMAKHWNIDKSDLVEPPKEKANKFMIPVLGTVIAGYPIEAIENILDYEEISENMARQGEFFALRVKSDSMEPRIKEGDIVIVRKQDDVDNGDLAVMLVNGDEATLKKIQKFNGGINLIPSNPSYAVMTYTSQEILDLPVRCLGKVVELRARF